jgi:hypothetical protein
VARIAIASCCCSEPDQLRKRPAPSPQHLKHLDCRNRLQLAADTLLPADIIDAILDGRQPADLSPGGADSVAIIAMASNVDVAFLRPCRLPTLS